MHDVSGLEQKPTANRDMITQDPTASEMGHKTTRKK
jgi:hypothetical protein